MTLRKEVRGSRKANLQEWYEYPTVRRHSSDVARLKRLHDVRIDHAEADAFVITACAIFDLPLPFMAYTARTDRGMYFPHGDGIIRIRPYDISLAYLCHELAHHWVEQITGETDGHHGWDFTWRLDRLAELAERGAWSNDS